MVLQGTGDDLAGRGRALIDQHHQRDRLEVATGHLFQAFQRVRATAALVIAGRGLVYEFAFSQLAVGRHHGDIFRQKRSRDGHGGIKVTARVIAQVQHQPLQIGLLFVHVFHLAGKVCHRAFLELAQANPAITGLDHLGFDALGLDFFAHDGHREGPAFFLAENAQQHFRAGFAAHAFHTFVERHAFHRCVVNLDDQVIGFEASAKSRGVLNR